MVKNIILAIIIIQILHSSVSTYNITLKLSQMYAGDENAKFAV